MAIRGEDKRCTLEERQLLLLRRNWELLDQLKTYRAQLPFFACTMLLALTGFVLGSDRIPSSRTQALGIVAIDVVVAGVSVWMICVIKHRYQIVNTKISYLYGQMGMTGEKFAPALDENALILFTVAITAVVLVGMICAGGVWFAPVH